MNVQLYAVVYAKGDYETYPTVSKVVLRKTEEDAYLEAEKIIMDETGDFDPDMDTVSIFDLSQDEEERDDIMDPGLLNGWIEIRREREEGGSKEEEEVTTGEKEVDFKVTDDREE